MISEHSTTVKCILAVSRFWGEGEPGRLEKDPLVRMRSTETQPKYSPRGGRCEIHQRGSLRHTVQGFPQMVTHTVINPVQ